MMDLSPWFQNADAIARAIDATGVDPALACAVVEMESGGRHVYGNDSGGVFSTPGTPDIDVTAENYAEYLRRVLAGAMANGVGIMQITWAGSKRADGTREGGFHSQAIREGIDLSDPYGNCLFGFDLVDEYHRQAGGTPTEADVAQVGRWYNGTDSYGVRLWPIFQKWQARLATPTPAPEPIPEPEPAHTPEPEPAPEPAPAPGPTTEPITEPITEPVTEDSEPATEPLTVALSAESAAVLAGLTTALDNLADALTRFNR